MKRYRLKKKYLILLMVLTSLVFFFVVFKVSYAFFTSRVTSNDYVITTGNLEINYTKTGNVINLNNAYPMTNTEGLATTGYSFNITNNGNISTKYQIRLELDSNNTIPMEYIKLAYIKTKTNSHNVDEAIEPVLLSNLNATQTFITDQVINPTKTDSYTLKLWIDFSAPNDIQGKTFKAKIVIDALQNVEDGYVFNSTTPIITLNKDNNGNTDISLIKGESFTDPGVLSIKDDKDLLTVDNVNITYEYTSDGTNLETVDSIDTNTTGVYYINYQVADSSNNIGKASRVVTVNNTKTKPEISLKGDSTISIPLNSEFTDPGVTVDNNNHVAIIGEVNTNSVGTYIIRYIVIDNNGSVNSVVRNILVNEVTVWEFAFDPDNDGEGQIQTFKVPATGNYKLEAWGAQGGNAVLNNYQNRGGYGGYSVGTISLNANDVLYTGVGGVGIDVTQTNSVATFSKSTPGYNGGTYASYAPTNSSHAGGGGATHIALDSGVLSSLSLHATDGRILIVAGGGGGASSHVTDGVKYSGSGGSGGGFVGNNSNESSSCTYCYALGRGGSQTSGGTYVHVSGTIDYPASSYYGFFGQGGTTYSSNTVSDRAFVSGGGGGYYGGSAGIHYSGAGGSGYIASQSLIQNTNSNIVNKMYCYNCTESSDLNAYTVSTYGTTTHEDERDITNCPDGYSSEAISKCAKAGNGYARITYLGN